MTDYGAAIDVNSDGKGTTFALYSPSYSREKFVSEKDVDIASLGGTGSVLIVDDEKDQRGLFNKICFLW